MDTGKALSRVLLISADLVNNLLVSDVIELEIDKTGRWIEVEYLVSWLIRS